MTSQRGKFENRVCFCSNVATSIMRTVNRTVGHRELKNASCHKVLVPGATTRHSKQLRKSKLSCHAQDFDALDCNTIPHDAANINTSGAVVVGLRPSENV
jgi:hypothetical protein